MLFNEPKLLKFQNGWAIHTAVARFSALQRAEIAEIARVHRGRWASLSFSALQRAEIAEIRRVTAEENLRQHVSVLFNEPKLLKSRPPLPSSPVF